MCSTTESPNDTGFTMGVVLAAITHRLKKNGGVALESYEAMMSTFLKKEQHIKEIKRMTVKSSKYSKILSSPERLYPRCDIKKYRDGKIFVEYLEHHPTFKVAKSHKNNVTWHQISEMIQFTVDLVEECYEVGRTELVRFLIGWCVSFINKQSCIYTSDGWADMLTILPCTRSLSSKPAPTHAASILSQDNTDENQEPGSVKEDYINNWPPYESLSNIPEWELHRHLSRTKIVDKMSSSHESSKAREDLSSRDARDARDARDMSKAHESEKLSLLRCSCGKMNLKRKGNFYGVCGSSDCGKLTCSLCCSSVVQAGRHGHMALHAVGGSSVITKEHIEMNSKLFNSICRNCEKTNCLQNLMHPPDMARCKLCNASICNRPGCQKFGTRKQINHHLQSEHLEKAINAKGIASPSSDPSVAPKESSELHLLRCACGNMPERYGKFWGKCGKPSSDKCEGYMCLICGQLVLTTKRLRIHLGQHEVTSKGEITEKHLESNLKLHKKVCGQCGQQGSCLYTRMNEQSRARCRCCRFFICMMPNCEKKYRKHNAFQQHYTTKH